MKARRWSDAAAFRADPEAVPTVRPSRQQTVGLLVVLLLIAGAVVAVSYLVRPEKARAFDLVHGSVFLADTYAPVGIDLASGKPTVRLVGANKQVGAAKTNQVSVVPLDGATLLLNNGSGSANSGEFNEVDETGFVVKPDGSGVPLSARGNTTALGFAATSADTAPGSAYIERTGPDGTDVFLVNSVTVSDAVSAAAKVKPRASISVPAVGDARPGAGASANGDLWLVLKSDNAYSLSQLTVPANSGRGAELDNKTHGSVSPTTAIGVAHALGSDTTEVVGVAEPNRVRLFTPGQKKDSVTDLTLGTGVDSILPATNQDDRLDYLVHSNSGWSVASVRSDGQEPERAPLPSIPPTARLAQPTNSNGALYTVDRSSGEVYRIVPGAPNAEVTVVRGYPKQTGEAASLDDAYVVGHGPRVIVNSPGHSEALVLFTDGSRSPLVVRKSTAVPINAGSSATSYTHDKVDQTNQRTKPRGTSTAAPKSQPISTRVDCSTVNQKPHIPAITSATPGSRSVALGWTYPLLDQQDCAPSTYQVTVKVLSNDAPKPDGSVTVQGQQSINLGGLYPSTRYQLTVTAYLNKLATQSRPVTVTTGPEGPAAPTGVSASADSAGNWTVRWSSCGTVKQGCVAAVSWRVIPSFCDGVGLSGAPTPLNVPADPSTSVQAPVLYKGSDDLLGRGVQFQIQGTGAQGQAGTPSARSACVYSWTAPNVAAMALHASTPANTALGGSSRTDVTLNLGADPTRNVGGYGAKVTITLSGNGATQTKSFVFNGNQSVLDATFDGVRAGAVYTASAMVTPAHGGSSATVRPVQVQTRANWPNVSMTASCTSTGVLTCTPSITVSGISSAAANNERFTFGADIKCGNTVQHIGATGIDPSAGAITGASLSQSGGYYGSCSVINGTLQESSNQTPLIFGGSIDKLADVPINLPGPTYLNAAAGDFSATWDSSTSSTFTVRYTGTNENEAALTQSWTAAVVPPGAGSCQSVTLANLPISVTVPGDCIQAHGASDGWQVALQYTDAVGGGTHNLALSLAKPPTYQAPQCTPTTSQFAVAWGSTQAAGIAVTYGGSADSIAPCTNWSESLQDETGTAVCPGTSGSIPPPVTLNYADCGIPPAAGWQVVISWKDTSGNPGTRTITIPGDPPAS